MVSGRMFFFYEIISMIDHEWGPSSGPGPGALFPVALRLILAYLFVGACR